MAQGSSEGMRGSNCLREGPGPPGLHGSQHCSGSWPGPLRRTRWTQHSHLPGRRGSLGSGGGCPEEATAGGMLGTAGGTRPPGAQRSSHLLLRLHPQRPPPDAQGLGRRCTGLHSPDCSPRQTPGAVGPGTWQRVSGPRWSLHTPIRSLLLKQQLSLPLGPSSHSAPSHLAPVPQDPGSSEARGWLRSGPQTMFRLLRGRPLGQPAKRSPPCKEGDAGGAWCPSTETRGCLSTKPLWRKQGKRQRQRLDHLDPFLHLDPATPGFIPTPGSNHT